MILELQQSLKDDGVVVSLAQRRQLRISANVTACFGLS